MSTLRPSKPRTTRTPSEALWPWDAVDQARMAPFVANGAPTPADLPEEVSKPPEGIVLPPKDIRSECQWTLRVTVLSNKKLTPI